MRVETPVPHSGQQEPEQVECVWLASLTIVMTLRVRWVVYVSYREGSGAPIILPAVFTMCCRAFLYYFISTESIISEHFNKIRFLKNWRQNQMINAGHLNKELNEAITLTWTSFSTCYRSVLMFLFGLPHRVCFP